MHSFVFAAQQSGSVCDGALLNRLDTVNIISEPWELYRLRIPS